MECPREEVVGEWVHALSGARLTGPVDAELRAHVQVERRDAAFHARVHVRGREDEHTRFLTAEDCETLARAVVVILSVALDPVADGDVVQPAPVEPESADESAGGTGVAVIPGAPDRDAVRSSEGRQADADEAQPASDGDAAPAGQPARTPAERPRGGARFAPRLEAGVRVGAAVGDFILPAVGAGFVAAPFVGFRAFHARLVLQYWLPRSTMLAGQEDAGVRVQLASGGVRACPRLVRGRWSVPFCTGPDFGALPGRGFGSDLARATSAASFWAAWTFEVGAEVRLLRFLSVWTAFEGAISLNRPGFLLGDSVVHRVGRFGPRGAIGVAFHR